jgi:hypothetical protein
VHRHVAPALGRAVAVRAEELAQRDVLHRADLRRRERLAAEIVGAVDARVAPDHEGRAARGAAGEHAEEARAVPRVRVDDGARTRDPHVDGVPDERLDDARTRTEAPRLDPHTEGLLDAARGDAEDDGRVRQVRHVADAQDVAALRAAGREQGRRARAAEQRAPREGTRGREHHAASPRRLKLLWA